MKNVYKPLDFARGMQNLFQNVNVENLIIFEKMPFNQRIIFFAFIQKLTLVVLFGIVILSSDLAWSASRLFANCFGKSLVLL